MLSRGDGDMAATLLLLLIMLTTSTTLLDASFMYYFSPPEDLLNASKGASEVASLLITYQGELPTTQEDNSWDMPYGYLEYQPSTEDTNTISDKSLIRMPASDQEILMFLLKDQWKPFIDEDSIKLYVNFYPHYNKDLLNGDHMVQVQIPLLHWKQGVGKYANTTNPYAVEYMLHNKFKGFTAWSDVYLEMKSPYCEDENLLMLVLEQPKFQELRDMYQSRFNVSYRSREANQRPWNQFQCWFHTSFRPVRNTYWMSLFVHYEDDTYYEDVIIYNRSHVIPPMPPVFLKGARD